MKILKQFTYFLSGALVLCFLSLMQKLISGYAVRLDAFIVPFFFGAAAGLIIGNLISKQKKQNKILLDANEKQKEANEELSQNYSELRGVYNELQVTRHKADESERLKSTFLSNLSHEIRTPLNGIVGFVQMLDDEDLETEERSHYIENILKSADRLIEIVSNIVEISKIEAGSVELKRNKVKLSEFLGKIYHRYKPYTDERQLELHLKNSIAESKSNIYCDVQKLEIILNHLIKNAVKFTPKGTVSFGAEIKDSFVEFFVEDTGIGIKKEIQENIFNRFSQGDGLMNTDMTGTGLGLSIAKAYVELMGGMMELESEVGKGSLFSFIIPYDRASS